MKKSRCTYMYTFILSCVLMTVMNISTAKTFNKGEIKFKPGSSSTTVSDAVVRGDSDEYYWIAGAGQWMEVKIRSPEDNAVFQLSIYPYSARENVQLEGAKDGDDANYWYGKLPSPGYSKDGKQNAVNIKVGGTRGNASYDLTVTIQNRNWQPSQMSPVCGLVTTKKSPLNIRQKANSKAKVIERAAQDSAVLILETLDSWYKVQLNDGTVGYASSQYIAKEDETGDYVFCGIVTTKNSSLNIRAGQNQKTKMVGRAKNGTALHVLGIFGSWYKVKLNDGTVGYASSDYIDYSPGEYTVSDKTSPVCGLVTTKKSPLNIRQKANPKAKVIERAAQDSAVLILETLDSWYKVQLNDGTIGYASSQYIAKEDETGDYVFCGIVTTKNSSLNIRAGQNQKTKMVGSAQKGTALHVLGIFGAWYKVKLNDGTVGYAGSDYIDYFPGEYTVRDKTLKTQ